MHSFFHAFSNYFFDFIELISICVAIVSLLIVTFYYLYYFIKLCYNQENKDLFNHPISVIICAKNELKNLQKNLPAILSQNYFNFEVVVVNDQSTDQSIFFLDTLAKKHKNLVIVNIDDFVTHSEGKKFALTLGIKTAQYEHLLLTDADCLPKSDTWIRQMSCNFNYADIVLGYGSYERKHGLLNKIIRYDTFNVAQQYLSFAFAGQAYMGVGRNLAYKKSLFFDNKGFANHIHVPSGDDDLFIQEIAPESSLAIEICDASHTISDVIESWKDWIYQKRRHLSTAPFYKLKFKLLLGLYPLAQLLFFLSVITLFYLETDFFFICILLVVKLLVSYLVNYKTMKKLNVFDLYWFHPIYETLHLLVQGNFVLLNLFRKPKKWSR